MVSIMVKCLAYFVFETRSHYTSSHAGIKGVYHHVLPMLLFGGSVSYWLGT